MTLRITFDGKDQIGVIDENQHPHAFSLHWEEAKELAERMVGCDERETIGRVQVRRDETSLTLVDTLSPLVIGPMPLPIAAQLAAGIRAKVKEANELARAWEIIQDNTILVHSGAQFGLSDNPAIQRETLKAAACLAGGIPPEARVGTPTIIQPGAPKK